MLSSFSSLKLEMRVARLRLVGAAVGFGFRRHDVRDLDVAATEPEIRRLEARRIGEDDVRVVLSCETPAGPVLDAEITANRPDCLGHYGMAREVAAITHGTLLDPVKLDMLPKGKAPVQVEIEDFASQMQTHHGIRIFVAILHAAQLDVARRWIAVAAGEIGTSASGTSTPSA